MTVNRQQDKVGDKILSLFVCVCCIIASLLPELQTHLFHAQCSQLVKRGHKMMPPHPRDLDFFLLLLHPSPVSISHLAAIEVNIIGRQSETGGFSCNPDILRL